MCVIIVKRKGVDMPSENILKAAYMVNRDGMGVVSSMGRMRTLIFHKFMDHVKRIGKEDSCVIHFRLATHGSVRIANCHPFKQGNLYFFHNGILPVRPYVGRTDSETAFREMLYPVIRERGLDSAEALSAIESIRGCSRFAFYEDGEITTFGDFEDIDGVLYSNLRFMRYM